MMFGDEDDMEAKRMMLEKMRKFGTERMMDGLKRKPDLSITIAAGPAGARPPSKLREEQMDEPMGDEGDILTNPDAARSNLEKLREQSAKDKEEEAKRMMRPSIRPY